MKKLLLLAFVLCGTFLHAQLAIIAFEAKQINNTVQLQWTVGRGNTCQDLEVQQSFDGIHFTTIYTYLGICGEATFDQTYSWTQQNPQLNTDNFYRLNTSTGVVSDTITLHIIGYNEQGFLLSPNPAQNETTLFFYNPANQNYQAELFTAEGKIVFTSEKTTGNFIRIARPAGPGATFFFRLIPENGETQTGRIQFL
jgi:hypothetical protein